MTKMVGLRPELILLYFTAILNIAKCSNNEAIDYYSNMITREMARALTYPLPTDSSSFKPRPGATYFFGTYDYIIIGAGSAGAVIASRLTEDATKKVLLIEAGGEESDFSDIPRMNLFLRGLEFNWNYNTTPQTTCCLGMFDKKCAFPRGKGLGGSSIINALMYVRGNKQDFDNWCSQGNPGWCYKDVLHLFKKSEDFKIGYGDEGYHGRGGYMGVEPVKFCHPQVDAFIKANKELGMEEIDYNGRNQLGVARSQMNNINGRRDSTAKAFLRPAANRKNLKILTHTLATHIRINKPTNNAYGVEFSRNGHNYFAHSRKEVIVSAGSIGTPQLLMLSGVGYEHDLRRLHIPVISNLRVGYNLQDHATYFALHFETNHTEPVISIPENVEEYLSGFGRLTIGGNANALAFFKTNKSNPSPQPDIELIMIPSNNTSNYIQKAYHYNDESYNAMWTKINPRHCFTIFVILLHPKSKGTVKLNSKSPYDYPLIDAQYLSDKAGEDIETMYKGIQLAINISRTNAFQELNTKLVNATLPTCREHEYLSRSYWYCQLRQLTMNIFHPVGTCKMGPNPLNGAVVNHELRVHGIKNLRVADASVIPDALSGHTSAPAIMIGEMLSQLIKNGH